MASETQLDIVVNARDEATSKLKSMGGEISSAFNRISAVAAGAGVALGAFALKAVSDFSEAEAAQRQLEHATIDVAHGTREQLKALQDLSGELEKKGVLDGDAIATGLAQLETFGLSTDMVKKLGGSLADLAVNQFGVNASGEQLTQTANMIAKALNGQFGVLEKSGIRFTEAQKQMIQFGTETEKASALQEGLAQNLKYTNEVARGTTEGGIAHLKVEIGNISENIGGALVPALNKALTAIQPIIDKITDWTAKNPELVSKIVLVTGAILAMLAVVAPLIGIISAVGAAFAFIASPVGIAVGAIIALIAAIAFLIFNWQTVKAAVVDVWSTITRSIGQAVQSVIAWFTTLWSNVTTIANKMWEDMKNIFKIGIEFLLGLVDLFLQTFYGVKLTTLVNNVKNLWKGMTDFLRAAWQAFSDFINILWGQISAAFDAGMAAIQALITKYIKPIQEAWGNIWGGLKDAFTKKWEEVKKPVQQAFDWLKAKFDAIAGFLSGIGNAIKGGISSVVSRGASVLEGKATGGPVNQDQPYMIGEEGPELFIPKASGSIVPNHALAGAGGIGGVSVSISVGSISSDYDARRMGEMVGDSILSKIKSNLKF